ncbi:MAG: type II toxin-antitoxin system HicA family toxin [Candidatus Kapaibacterium sp.]
MPPVPLISTDQVIRVFESFGWSADRSRGSHIMMTKAGEIATLAIPRRRELPRGTLRSLIRNAELSIEQFNERYRQL